LAQYIYLASNIQNPFLFALLIEIKHRSSLTCQAFHRKYTSLPLAKFRDVGSENYHLMSISNARESKEESTQKARF